MTISSDHTSARKQCKICKTEQPIESFRRHGSTCRKCENDTRRKRESKPAVYKIYNTVTKRFYIGGSGRVMGRWRSHRNMLRRGVHDNYQIQLDYDRYGESTFEFNVIEYTDQYKEREAYWIETLKPTYNLDYAKNGRIQHTQETRRKISKANKGQISWTKGKTHVEISGVEGAAKRREQFIAMAKSRDLHGVNNPNVKLNQEIANEIRAKYGKSTPGIRKIEGRPTTEQLAKEYGVAPSTISRIIRNKVFPE